jgi:hypothetical protein
MNKEIIIVVFIVIFLSYYVDETYVNSEVTYVNSKIDGKRYLVRNLPDKQQAADILAKLNNNNLTLIKHLQNKFPNDERTIRLADNYDENSLSESTSENGYTSYTVNKTSVFACLREKETNKFIDFNTLSYSVFHEIAHQLTKSINHTKDFWKNFKWLLSEAVEINLYEKIDYSKNPVNFCGITINSSVLFD